ncbi:PSD1 and planctomycete cytochrome C domain-containing protein [Haloferula chungangensis]|uniref:PSD1 and planctomycete cytochrome C domain-containing protein n=1 Tax=Haloferula chungangensis TaxID=1048331 RepID=A0ABW2L8Z3_9BACT
MRCLFLLPKIFSLAALLFLTAELRADTESSERGFSLKVLPLLQEKCLACHGEDPEKIKGDLNLMTREGMLRGGESGRPVLVPGNAETSTLYQAVTWQDEDLEMPPKENDRLNPQQVEWIKQWIDGGAPWPDEATQRSYQKAERANKENEDGVIVDHSGGQADAWTYRRYQAEDLWAFQPVIKLALPGEQGNPIDGFISEKLAAAGFEMAPEADALTMIRRATYDLTGLPPTPGEIGRFQEAWEKDSDAALEHLVDRLLASPHYGERWAQHWLDVARYADTGGYSNDWERSNMWRYRDYVIRSFNKDKPYDEFILEQLAGDELADALVAERGADVHQVRLNGDYRAEESELLIATGFLRMGGWDTAMIKEPEARQIYLDDVVNSVGQTFLATTMRCFKCHDHKFDPLPTRDYYRMYAAFAGTQLAERKAPFLAEENRANFKSERELVERLLSFAESGTKEIKAKQEEAAKKWYSENHLTYLTEAQRNGLPDEMKPPRHVGLDYVEQGLLKVREQDEWIWTRRLERFEPMVQSVYNGQRSNASGKGARKLRMPRKIDEVWRPSNFVLNGGALEAEGEPVAPGVLSVIGLPVEGASREEPYLLPDDLEGRRLKLAKWIANPQNPLTTRSIVNRIWQHHFGEAIAGNPTNFGGKGKKPTHPELLDWLAADFVDGGWSFKRMHKQIMMSRAYRQSGRNPEIEALKNADPDNRLLAYFPPRRLNSEELRDSFLAVTGELNRELGGLPIRPEITMEVALQPRMLQFSLAPAYQPSPTPEQRNRRTIYAYRVRGMADPFLEIFNQPNPNDACEARTAATVTPQVFTLLNSSMMIDRSMALARRLEKENPTLGSRIDAAFKLGLGRSVTSAERERMMRFVEDMTAYHAQKTPDAVQYPTSITRSLVEELSGKPFEYEEILPVFESYQPDLKPSEVPAETRALADFCLLIFNSNEFVYVY